jgi:hypothetical protein
VNRLGQWQRNGARNIFGMSIVALAVDQFPGATLGADPHSAHQNKKFDVAGIRLIAVNGLLLQMTATENYMQAERPQLMYVIEAWAKSSMCNTLS